MTQGPRDLTPEQIRNERRAATLDAYHRNSGLVSPKKLDPKKNFMNLAELSDLLETACGTCASRPPRGSCSAYGMLKHNQRTCQVDAGRCVYAFLPNIHRTDEGAAECRCYMNVNSPEAIASSEQPLS